MVDDEKIRQDAAEFLWTFVGDDAGFATVADLALLAPENPYIIATGARVLERFVETQPVAGTSAWLYEAGELWRLESLRDEDAHIWLRGLAAVLAATAEQHPAPPSA